MPLSNDIRLYEDSRAILDQALDSPQGIKITYETHGLAINARQRLQKFRQLDKEQSIELYAVGDPRRGVTVYANLSLDIEPKSNVLVIRHREPPRIEAIE